MSYYEDRITHLQERIKDIKRRKNNLYKAMQGMDNFKEYSERASDEMGQDMIVDTYNTYFEEYSNLCDNKEELENDLEWIKGFSDDELFRKEYEILHEISGQISGVIHDITTKSHMVAKIALCMNDKNNLFEHPTIQNLFKDRVIGNKNVIINHMLMPTTIQLIKLGGNLHITESEPSTSGIPEINAEFKTEVTETECFSFDFSHLFAENNAN